MSNLIVKDMKTPNEQSQNWNKCQKETNCKHASPMRILAITTFTFVLFKPYFY